ncbi:MAG TPA: delta-60 repeat domain-containing protein, partial [Pyrinomonadaceae bacterium]|nr:delta-60 repeat domain-containing protein [Pyrinomonadaceae bacterium]
MFVETNGAVSIPVLRRGALDSTSSVEVVSAPLYYVNLPFKTNLVFGPGVTERIALLPLTNDTRIDARRTLQVHLTNQAPTAVLGAPRLAELSILDASSQQFPGALDPNYFVKLDFLPNLFAYPGPIVVMPDGKLVIASGFNTVNGTPSTPVARINTDGSLDSSFHYAGTNQPALIASFGEKVYLASNGGLKPVVRLLANGSEDPAFVAPTFSFEGDPSFRFMTTDTNGNVLIIGSFTNINGFSRSHVARIRPDGSLDPDFNALPAPGVSYRDSIVMYHLPDGTYLLGGAARRVDNEAHPLLTHLSASGSVLGGYEIPDVPMDREWDLWAVVAI